MKRNSSDSSSSVCCHRDWAHMHPLSWRLSEADAMYGKAAMAADSCGPCSSTCSRSRNLELCRDALKREAGKAFTALTGAFHDSFVAQRVTLSVAGVEWIQKRGWLCATNVNILLT